MSYLDLLKLAAPETIVVPTAFAGAGGGPHLHARA